MGTSEFADEKGIRDVRTQRRVYTNNEFTARLASGRPVPTDPFLFETYMERLDNGLYYMGWRVEARLTYFIARDEMTAALTEECVGRDEVIWRAALMWAEKTSKLFGTIEHRISLPRSITTPTEREYYEFYKEYFIP